MSVAILAALALAAQGGGAEPAVSASDRLYQRCVDRTTTNTDWAQCGGDWVKREDYELNRTWSDVYSGLPAQSKTDLLADQRRWIAFKDASCAVHSNGDWGREGQVLDYFQCKARLIKDRVRYLRTLK